MPVGTPFEVTNTFVKKIANAALDMQEEYLDEDGTPIIMNVLSTTGGRGGVTHSGRVRFEIVPPEKRANEEIDARFLVSEWRKRVGIVPGAESLTFRAEWGRSSSPIDIQLSGNDMNVLNTVAEQVKGQLATYPAIFDIEDSMANGKQELQLN